MNEELVMHVDHLFEIASNNCAWLKVVAEMFGCDVIALDTGISIKGSDDVIHKAEEVLKSMDSILAKKEQLDLLSVRYLCLLEKENRLSEFMADEDPVILTTPAGRSVRAKTLGSVFMWMLCRKMMWSSVKVLPVPVRHSSGWRWLFLHFVNVPCPALF